MGEEKVRMRLSARRQSLGDIQRIKMKYKNTGDLYRAIIPHLLNWDIISKKTATKLKDDPKIEVSIHQKQLMELLIKWEYCTDSTEFWRRHKTKEDLLEVLRFQIAAQDHLLKKKNEEARRKEDAEYYGTSKREDEKLSEEEHLSRRRNSLVALAQIMDIKEYSGDKFGTQGDYNDAIIYASRRPPARKDDASSSGDGSESGKESRSAKSSRPASRRGSAVGGATRSKRLSATPNPAEVAAMAEPDDTEDEIVKPSSILEAAREDLLPKMMEKELDLNSFVAQHAGFVPPFSMLPSIPLADAEGRITIEGQVAGEVSPQASPRTSSLRPPLSPDGTASGTARFKGESVEDAKLTPRTLSTLDVFHVPEHRRHRQTLHVVPRNATRGYDPHGFAPDDDSESGYGDDYDATRELAGLGKGDAGVRSAPALGR